MTRRDVQQAGRDLFCASVPEGHGDLFESMTSGSTGEPVTVRRTELSALFWEAMALRDHAWHRRDLSGRMCTVTPAVTRPTPRQDWGAPAARLSATGPSLALPITAGIEQLARWISDFSPTFLVVFPSTLRVLTDYCEVEQQRFEGFECMLTIGETLSPAVRREAARWFDVPIADTYSSEEIGQMALCCPVSGLYHVMAETTLAEVLDDDGEPCRAGEAGRVVVTDLHNYATPIVRYDIGDIAEVADPCPCGRGLPAWRRIVGRQRHLILMPDGRRCWPVTGFPRCRDVAPVRQYQLAQVDRQTFDVRLVVERALTANEERRLATLFRETIGHPFDMRFHYVADRLPSGPSGKFEEFVCEIAG